MNTERSSLTLNDAATGNCPASVPPWAQDIVDRYNDKYGGTGQLAIDLAAKNPESLTPVRLTRQRAPSG